MLNCCALSDTFAKIFVDPSGGMQPIFRSICLIMRMIIDKPVARYFHSSPGVKIKIF